MTTSSLAADRLPLARGLGFASLGLAYAALAAPRGAQAAAGVSDHDALTRVFGVRELGVGLALLAAERVAPWLWARVAGDVMDLGLLGVALAGGRTRRDRTLTVMANVAAILALDAWAAVRAGADEAGP